MRFLRRPSTPPVAPRSRRPAPGFVIPLLFSLAVVCAFTGCGRGTNSLDQVLSPSTTGLERSNLAPGVGAGSAPAVAGGDGLDPPAEVAAVTFGVSTLQLWPYTGTSFDGTPSDPVNLLFVGNADPVAIRDALLSLDGNRSAAGFPPVPPFDAKWSDAIGDAQTNWVEGEGWTGSAIQLQLGDYEPLRVHLRLFRTGAPSGGGGTWTVGAAHFEVMIPGTADHQVLSWELAEQVVIADLVRSGLLDSATPLSQTGMLHDAPTFREIPPFIYNALPAELVGLVGGPPQPASAGVGIPTDGRATVLHLAGRAPRAGNRSQSFTITYDQVVPRPFCADGPTDWIHVAGPVRFEKTAVVDDRGGYRFDSKYSGRLTATPVDVTQSPPIPAGASFEAMVGEQQKGAVSAGGSDVTALSRRLIPGAGGTEIATIQLRVGSNGAKRYDVHTRCQ